MKKTFELNIKVLVKADDETKAKEKLHKVLHKNYIEIIKYE